MFALTKLAPGEWACGPYPAVYDEHTRSYSVYDETGERVTVVRRLTALTRFVRCMHEAAA